PSRPGRRPASRVAAPREPRLPLSRARPSPRAVPAPRPGARLPRSGRARLQPAPLRPAQRSARAGQAGHAEPDRRRAAHDRVDARGTPADNRSQGGRDHGLPALRRDPRQRGPLLPELRPADGPPRRPADRRGAGRSARRPGRCPLGRLHISARRDRACGRTRPGTRAAAEPAGARCATCACRAAPDHLPAPDRLARARGARPLPRAAAARRDRDPGGRRRPRRPRGDHGDHPSWRRLLVSTQAPAAPPSPAAPPHAPPPGEACPLCGAPLAPDQEWCLHCGAAARTRLAAAPNWRVPVIAVASVAAIALAVLAVALVKLAGDSGPAPAPVVTTVTTPAAAAPAATAPAPAAPGASTTPG